MLATFQGMKFLNLRICVLTSNFYKSLMISFLPEAGFSALLLPDLLFHGRR